MKYRKGNMIIEAIQFTGKESIKIIVSVWPEIEYKHFNPYFSSLEYLEIKNSHCGVVMRLNYIIKHETGFYSCDKEMFEREYEKI